MAELQAKLAAKQGEMANELEGGGSSGLDQQREEYARRGITLAADAHDERGKQTFEI